MKPKINCIGNKYVSNQGALAIQQIWKEGCRAESTWGKNDKGIPYVTVYTGGKMEEYNRFHACKVSSNSKSLFLLYHSELWRQEGKGKTM